MHKLISQCGNSSETGRDMINPVGYRVLMTYHNMPAFHTVQIEVQLYNPNDLIKLSDVFYLL